MDRPRTLIVLAGGQSRRMGRDKAQLSAGAGTLLDRIIDRLLPVVEQVIVAGGSPPQRADVRWVPDDRPGAGPLAGIAAGLSAMLGEYGWAVACDLPDVEARLGEQLFAYAHEIDAVVPRPDGRPEGLCAIYHRRLVPRIQTMLDLGDRRVGSLLDAVDVRYVDTPELQRLDPELRSFRNLNTPEEYRAWLDSVS